MGEVEFVKKTCKPLLIEVIVLHKRADIINNLKTRVT